MRVSHSFNRVITALLFTAVTAIALSWSAATRAADSVTEPVMLVAKPELGEFYKSTVLFVRPMGNGRHIGFIVNRPTPMTLGKLFPEHAPSAKVSNPVLLGGPFNVDSVFAVVNRGTVAGEKSIPLTPKMSMMFDAPAVDKVIEGDGNNARFFVGLIVWQPGELNEEIEKNFWFVAPADETIIFRNSTDGVWEELVRKLGGTSA